MTKIRVAVVGTGHLGARHLKIFSELRDRVTIAGICDIDSAKLKALSQEYQVPTFTNYRELLPHVDAVNICVPTVLHYKIARDFLNAQVHTFIEKPIATSVAEAQELTALAKAHHCKLQVGHIERFNAAFQSIKRFAKNPLFVECHRLNRFPNRSLDIGVVMDLMIHDIDIVLGLMDQTKVKDIQSVGVQVLTDKEDIANTRLTFENGCVCNLTASRISADVMRKIRIFLPNMYISLDYVNQEAFVYKKVDGQILKHALPIEKEEPLKAELNSFLDCLAYNQDPIVGGEEAAEALRLALEIMDKISQNPRYAPLSV